MRSLSRILTLALALGVLAQSALAQPSPDAVTKAKSHFKQGKAYQDAGAFDEAIAEYQKAYELAPLPDLLFNIGQAYRLKGDKRQALAFYQQFLDGKPEGAGADEARTWVAQLTVDIKKEDEAARAVAATQPASLPATEPATEPASLPVVVPPIAPVTPSGHEGRGLKMAGLASAGAGVLVAALGGYFGVVAMGKSDDAAKVADSWTPEHKALVEDGQAAQTDMFICYGVAAVAIAGGVSLYILGTRAHAQEAPRTAIAPLVAPGAGGLVLTGEF